AFSAAVGLMGVAEFLANKWVLPTYTETLRQRDLACRTGRCPPGGVFQFDRQVAAKRLGCKDDQVSAGVTVLERRGMLKRDDTKLRQRAPDTERGFTGQCWLLIPGRTLAESVTLGYAAAADGERQERHRQARTPWNRGLTQDELLHEQATRL